MSILCFTTDRAIMDQLKRTFASWNPVALLQSTWWETPRIRGAAAPTLHHPDLHKRNVFVSNDDPAVITGINYPVLSQRSGMQTRYQTQVLLPTPYSRINLSLIVSEARKLLMSALDSSSRSPVPAVSLLLQDVEGWSRGFST